MVGCNLLNFTSFFRLGDGAGVGKGRTIAGLILENFIEGRKKAIWVSVSNDLKYDSERDLKDIGAKGIDVHFLSKVSFLNQQKSFESFDFPLKINNVNFLRFVYVTYNFLRN